MKFAYLNLKDHPRGNIILKSLILQGLIPSIIIEEDSSLAQKNRSGIVSAFKDSLITFPLTQDIVADLNVPVFLVENHNDEKCEELLRRFEVDLIVLGDTRVMKKNIIDIPKVGIINSHPGYLPDVKGNNPYIWAIINDLPQGCSIHFIDENVDTGDVILRERIDLSICKSYTDLLRKINDLCADLMVEAVRQIKSKTYLRTPQSKLQFIDANHVDKEFYAATSELKEMAIKKLEGQS